LVREFKKACTSFGILVYWFFIASTQNTIRLLAVRIRRRFKETKLENTNYKA
jgi:hypothetical protein